MFIVVCYNKHVVQINRDFYPKKIVYFVFEIN